MRVYQKSRDEIAKLYRPNQAVRKTLDELEAASKPGVSTWELNEVRQGGTFLSPLNRQRVSLPPPRVTRASSGLLDSGAVT